VALKIHTQIPYGNACDVEIMPGEVSEVRFAPDPHGGPECLWFCFRLEQDDPEDRASRVRLTLKHSANMLGGYSPLEMRSVCRYAGGDWERLGVPDVEVLPDGRNRVTWTVAAPKTTVDVAYCYPYGPPEVDALMRETDGYWRADTIGVSQSARPLVRLSNDYGQEGATRPGLYVLARQHAGETPGSWVLDGFLRRLTEMGSDAPLVWAVPLTNIDGVMGGDYGKDNFPYDLNRAWGTPPMRHEVLVLQHDFERWKERCRPALAIDLHAPGACETTGIYVYVPDPATYPEMHASVLEWTAAIKSALKPEYASRVFERIADYPSRWETPAFSRYSWTKHDLCGIGVETPYAMIGDKVLTRTDYREAGARMADGVVRQLRVKGMLG
jgi:hypothetical protein